MGKDVKHSIKRIFEKLYINDDLLCEYSNKKSFSSLNICSTIFGKIFYKI